MLNKIGLDLLDENLISAQFLFWPRYDDNTEPDLVIIAGDYYILIEAKYFSGFGEETINRKSQLSREIEGGILEAKTLKKQFVLVAITADYSYNSDKLDEIKRFPNIKFKWINWQFVSNILSNYLNNHEEQNSDYLISRDLYDLLEKKNLRTFISLNDLKFNSVEPIIDRIFFKVETTKYRGAFIGFNKALENQKTITHSKNNVFFYKTYFDRLPKTHLYELDKIFFKGAKENG